MWFWLRHSILMVLILLVRLWKRSMLSSKFSTSHSALNLSIFETSAFLSSTYLKSWDLLHTNSLPYTRFWGVCDRETYSVFRVFWRSIVLFFPFRFLYHAFFPFKLFWISKFTRRDFIYISIFIHVYVNICVRLRFLNTFM